MLYPVQVGYDITNVTGSRAIGSFSLSGITCAEGYSANNPSATVCNAGGLPYTLNGCTETDPAAATAAPAETPQNCEATFTSGDTGSGSGYTMIEGTEFANYDISSLVTYSSGSDINCEIIGDDDSTNCSGTAGNSISINCSNSSDQGTLTCNTSGTFNLGGCASVVNASGDGSGGGSDSEQGN